MEVLDLGDVSVDVIKKDIKNIHLSVYPPTGRVRISAPQRLSTASIRAFAIGKLGWIRQHQQKIQAQPREAPREYPTAPHPSSTAARSRHPEVLPSVQLG
jgi:predicted metal-dependent hydrolase